MSLLEGASPSWGRRLSILLLVLSCDAGCHSSLLLCMLFLRNEHGLEVHLCTSGRRSAASRALLGGEELGCQMSVRQVRAAFLALSCPHVTQTFLGQLVSQVTQSKAVSYQKNVVGELSICLSAGFVSEDGEACCRESSSSGLEKPCPRASPGVVMLHLAALVPSVPCPYRVAVRKLVPWLFLCPAAAKSQSFVLLPS